MREQKKSTSTWQVIIYTLIFTLFFTLLFSGGLLIFFGYDVLDAIFTVGQQTPFLDEIMPKPRDLDLQMQNQNMENRLQETSAQLTSAESRIRDLENSMSDKESEIEELRNQKERLEEEKDHTTYSDEDRLQKIRELARIYGGMTASKAAAVIENLTYHEAALIMEQMDPEQQSRIMAKLEPAFAAYLTVMLKEINEAEDPDLASLQERITMLMDSVDSSKSTVSIIEMANTFAQMPAQQAAQILGEMSSTSEQFDLGIKIMAHLTEISRSAIMAEMDSDFAIDYTNALLVEEE